MRTKPCPFCGGEEIRVEYRDGTPRQYYCYACRARGPNVESAGSPEARLDAWNRRAGSADPDLLAACEHLMAIISDQGDDHYPALMIIDRDEVEFAKRAISRAKGI